LGNRWPYPFQRCRWGFFYIPGINKFHCGSAAGKAWS
jgi:hypothetical protein